MYVVSEPLFVTVNETKAVPDDYLSGLSAGFAKRLLHCCWNQLNTRSRTACTAVKQPPEPAFDGLKGLTGAFVKQPAATAIEKSAKPAANQDKAKQDDYMPGLGRGFFK